MKLRSSAWIWQKCVSGAPNGSEGKHGVSDKTIAGRDSLVLCQQPPCTAAIEACASAHHWSRTLCEQGHQVKQIPPIYAMPFVKRQKNDAAT